MMSNKLVSRQTDHFPVWDTKEGNGTEETKRRTIRGGVTYVSRNS